MGWWEKWVGVAAPPEVQAPCWWLIRRVYETETDLLLPEEGVFAPKQQWARLIQRGLRGAWERLEGPQDLAIALIHLPAGWHLGVVAADQPPKLLSTADGRAVLQRLSRYVEAGIIRGFYAYRPPASGRRHGNVPRSTSMRPSVSKAALRT